MRAKHLLNKLEARGVRLYVENDSLRIQGEKGKLSAELLYEIKAHKAELIHELTRFDAGNYEPEEPPLPKEAFDKLVSIAKILLKMDAEAETARQSKIDSGRDPKNFPL